MRVEVDLSVRERGPRELQADLRLGDDLSVPRAFCDEHHEPRDWKPQAGRSRKLDVTVVRRVERAAEEADHANSTSSSPISTSSPGFAPAARNASASSPSAGGRPATRKPVSVRKIRNRR